MLLRLRIAPLFAPLLALCMPLPATALDASLPPSGNFALGHWKLTLPVDAQGHKVGEAAEVLPPVLTAGYRSNWFRTAADGGLDFWAPVNGATTDESDYPRSELRELVDADDDNVNWSAGDDAVLAANCSILRVPAGNGKVVIGQIHAFGGPPLVKLRYQFKAATQTGRLDALVNVLPTDTGTTAYPLATDIPLGKAFNYRIEVHGNVLTMSADGGATTTLDIASAWQQYSFYFKAGVYVQANGDSSSDGGWVRFYKLGVSH
ncbi:MAG: polysaccharide lyase family 7 protein [Solimonas sp.]